MKVYRCILPALFVAMAGWQLCAASLCGVHTVQIGYDTLVAHRGEPVTAASARYTDNVAKAPRRRGVMSRAGDMTEDDFKTLKSWGASGPAGVWSTRARTTRRCVRPRIMRASVRSWMA